MLILHYTTSFKDLNIISGWAALICCPFEISGILVSTLVVSGFGLQYLFSLQKLLTIAICLLVY